LIIVAHDCLSSSILEDFYALGSSSGIV
jgi:hypothetical protein